MPSLWSPTDWPQRLAELQASSGELKEAPLRRDVRSLGMLLGEVLREQAGDSFYDAVEALRRTAIARREAEAPQSGAANAASATAHLQQALDRVRTLDLPAAYQLTRAFGFYFELINLAETNHRKRRRISDLLEQLDRIPVPEPQLEALERDLIAEITALWQTDDVRSARPTVRDEIRMALDYYESSLFDTLPVLYGEVGSALAAEYPVKNATDSVTKICDLPLLIRFGSWIGGDRDGNPFVTPQATRDALAMAHALLLTHYRRRLQNIFEQLASSTQQVPVSAELIALLEHYLGQLRTAGQNALEERFLHESVRLLIACIMMRLGATPQSAVPVPANPALTPYTRAADLLSDLTILRNSLVENSGHRLAEMLIDPLLMEVRTYGLHLQTLDIRQHARVHAAAIAEMSAWQPAAACQSLTLPPALTEQTAEVLDTFRTIAELKQRYSPESIRQYVISGATSADDVLHVLWLARLGGVRVEAAPPGA